MAKKCSLVVKCLTYLHRLDAEPLGEKSARIFARRRNRRPAIGGGGGTGLVGGAAIDRAAAAGGRPSVCRAASRFRAGQPYLKFIYS